MKMKLYFFIIVSICIMIGGCKLDTYVELYVGDILDAFQEELSTQGKLKAYITSNDECTKNKDKIIKIISRYMGDLKDEGCQSKGMDNFLVLGVSYPVTSKEQKSVFSIFVSGNESVAVISLKLNRDQYDRLNAEIEKEFNDGIDLDESKIEIKLVNDQRKPVEMISSSVFIDNKPVLNPMLKLGKRKSVDIKFSNVHSAHFDEYNEVELFKLKM
jgi:hypothetical protein